MAAFLKPSHAFQDSYHYQERRVCLQVRTCPLRASGFARSWIHVPASAALLPAVEGKSIAGARLHGMDDRRHEGAMGYSPARNHTLPFNKNVLAHTPGLRPVTARTRYGYPQIDAYAVTGTSPPAPTISEADRP